jgi:hypothetical protein
MIAATEARLLAKLDEVNAENDRLKLRFDNMETYTPAQPRTVPRKAGAALSGQNVPGWKTGGQFYEALKRRMEEGSVWASERQERMKQWKTDQELQAIAASNFSINSMATGAVDIHLDDKMMRFEVDSTTTFELLLDMCNGKHKGGSALLVLRDSLTPNPARILPATIPTHHHEFSPHTYTR